MKRLGRHLYPTDVMSEPKSTEDETNATSGAAKAAPELSWIKNTNFLSKYNMSGRTAVITGGGSGIGYACAAALCSVGAHVVITGRNEKRLQNAVAELQRNNGSAECVAFDVSDQTAVRDAAKTIGDKHGKVHVLINNAGVGQGSVPTEAGPAVVFDKILKTNLYGAYWCVQSFLPYMKGFHPGASIINIGSISGKVAHANLQQVAYNTSKAALHHMSSSLAIELIRENIRVNAVAPGLIRTNMTRGALEGEKRQFWMNRIPMQRFAEPDEVAQSVLHLASEASSYVNGAVWVVDGGFCAI